MLPFGSSDASLALLEKGAAEVSRPSRKFWSLKDFLYHLKAVENNNRCATNKNRENVAMLLFQLNEGFTQVPDIQIREGAEESDAGGTRREVAGSYRRLNNRLVKLKIQSYHIRYLQQGSLFINNIL